MSQTQKEVPRLDSRANKWPKYKVGENPDRPVPAEAARSARGARTRPLVTGRPGSKTMSWRLALGRARDSGCGEDVETPKPHAPVAGTRKDAVTTEAGVEVSRRRKPGVTILCAGPACGHLCVPKN